jgi:hypothetical protein
LPRIRIAPDPRSVTCPTGLSEKDWPIYRAAAGCRADILLTGDIKDFGFLMNDPAKTSGILIQTNADVCRRSLRQTRPRLGWAGLGWAGLGWAGLGWAGLAD